MNAEPKHTLDEVLEAIKGSSAIKRTIADRLRVHRATVDRYLVRWPTAKRAYDEEVENIGDAVEGVILSGIYNKDIEAAKWYAAMKLKHRGYAPRQEVTGAQGGPVKVQVFDYDNFGAAFGGLVGGHGTDDAAADGDRKPLDPAAANRQAGGVPGATKP